ncbi:MAG: hypothetical protein KDE56_22015 [Anaerolineales bacterium]|nr:hypothetical protein [Anaerolineales bacterium]
MAIKMALSPKQKKITVTLSETLVQRLDKRIPARQRSHFIALAIENQLAIEEQLVALAETAGAWADKDYPEMQSDTDIDAWLTNLRASWQAPDPFDE